ncbi:Asparagine--tRNA ligase [Labeo rohita]|uniref:Asparagine--tRNA ligase n=1 Tax=Labeo rohita TaxID=84645 RepID=A0ABQ8L3R8_LABRO|nr:Asparagine--tRNA ligase [Labeo rohita]
MSCCPVLVGGFPSRTPTTGAVFHLRSACPSVSGQYFATGDSFRTIASSFHVGVSTVCKVFPDVVTAIWDCLVEEFMAVPWSIVEGFEER